MNPANDINALKMAKVKCMASLLFFTRYFFKHKQNRKFVVSEHHITICNALERVLKGECKRLIINIAPRYGKTEIAVKNFIAHGLALNPSAKFIHLSYSDGLALDNSEEVKDLINEESYQQLFPNVQIKKDSRAKNKWYTTEGGGVLARSAAGQVTGFGAGKVDDEEAEINEFITDLEQKQGFSGAIIIDDPIKPEDADSDTVRDRVNNRFDSTIRNRVNSRNTPIIVIMQRLHPKDLSGYLMETEPGEWEVISLPCIKEDGTALWPFKHTVEELKKLEQINPLVFARQYMQNPKPKEGLMFPEDELQYYSPNKIDVEKLSEYRYAFIDPAGAAGGDDLSMPVGYLVQGKIFIHDVIYNNHGTDYNEPACVEMICRHRLNYTEVEGVSGWALFGRDIRDKVADRMPDSEVRVVKENKNKHTRIYENSAFIKQFFVFREDYRDFPQYRKFMQVLTSYMRVQVTANPKDDAPDSCAGMAKYFRSNFKHIFYSNTL